MASYQEARVKLINTQLNDLKSAAKKNKKIKKKKKKKKRKLLEQHKE